jgi:FkbM family methyltransferase
MFSVLQTVGWSPRTILDIGGYKGHWTRQVRSMFPFARVTIVEPNHHKELETIGVPVHYEVLSSEISQVPWYSNMTTGDSLYKELTRHYSNVSPTMRTTTTLDTLFPGEQFDCIKLDCQGAELDILKGGKELLNTTDVVLMECPFAGKYNEGAPTFIEYIQYMDSIGFSPLDITELHRANEILCQIDILFLRKTSPLWSTLQTKITN